MSVLYQALNKAAQDYRSQQRLHLEPPALLRQRPVMSGRRVLAVLLVARDHVGQRCGRWLCLVARAPC